MATVDTAFGLAGLTAAEARQRLAEGRGNLVAWDASRSYSQILRDNAVTPVNIVLFAICAVLLGLGLFGDALLTGGLVVGNIVVGVFQETRAKRQLDRIALLTRPRVRVIRDGTEVEVLPTDVVEGDLLVLLPGDQAVVDGPVVVSRALGVDESLLTGEADTIEKREGESVVSGSFCVAGTGVYEATKVGTETMASQITAQARAHRAPQTPLQREVGVVVSAMSLVAVFLGAQAVRSLSAVPGEVSLSEATRAAAVIVALVPQGLVVMVTVSYAMAAVRMAGSGILVQRMNALESISHVDVLCIDKTGTITTNQLKLETLVPLESDEAHLRTLLGDFAASASHSNRTLDGIREGIPGEPRPVRSEVPFESKRGWSALAFGGQGLGWLVLGAPEALLPCVADSAALEGRVVEWAEKGLRVLLFASTSGVGLTEGPDAELPESLEALGLVILRDETRPDAPQAVAELTATGIGLKIISGDHPETVAALAKQAGIEVTGEPVAGSDLEEMSDDELAAAAHNTTIFGRISPSMKEKLVRALQAAGHYVAMIGDGVNDVPAMKSAQVAVAVRSGSGITRSIADLVLLRDEFSRLPSAFREGQRVRMGMAGIFRLFLTRTLSLTLILILVSLLGDPFPVSPRHTGLIALMTVGIPTLGLAAWAQPGRTGRTIIAPSARFVVPAATTIAAVALVMFEFYWHTTEDLDQARTALTITCVLCGLLTIVFLEPPTPAWTGGSTLSGDWRPTIMAGVLAIVFFVTLASPALRDFYELKLPDVWGFMVIFLAVGAWAVALRAIWRFEAPPWLEESIARMRSPRKG